jgi:phosphoenolpyruvate-protein kinase (PTS system EI component)
MIPRVRSVLAQIDTREAQQVAQRCLAAASADEVEAIVRDEFKTRWPDLFSPSMLPRVTDN